MSSSSRNLSNNSLPFGISILGLGASSSPNPIASLGPKLENHQLQAWDLLETVNPASSSDSESGQGTCDQYGPSFTDSDAPKES